MKTTDLHDEFGEQLQVCEPIFQSFGGKKQFHGNIRTVRVYEDNVLVRKALETIEEGEVLIVDGGGSMRCALLGDNLAAIALTRKLGGIIIHGCVRDVAELCKMNIGIYALNKVPVRSQKIGRGATDMNVMFGGVTWRTGEYVYVDEDGIITSAKALHEKW
ncbi:ribonuclease E activity regulator RraA [Priestia taiwanensis]|uniref:4-hydroxy-4-methyl-2-oxoglutarate aldolase n=1 Tax=Priestia taiwanensis TaxID=1347902 RepID=A0A917AVU3_9BACI|nr:ribonuclease E activity regulator RraA [Priestia taiwanensis]MBM7364505.1 regulator of ribonuclease activity A [Priestia taiwanensis]GGE80974.1 4-hydroxy-4-methyl-2-oxoglutarate aldolase [Priestia taiwanensis]